MPGYRKGKVRVTCSLITSYIPTQIERGSFIVHHHLSAPSVLQGSKRNQLSGEIVKERGRKRKAPEKQEEHGREFSEVDENVTAIGLLQQSAGPVSDDPGGLGMRMC